MDGPAFHQIPASRLHGSGVVWHVDVEPFGAIGRDMLQGQRPALREGDMLLLHTGWAQRFGTDTYPHNPALTVEAAQWLVAQGVKLLGVDFATPDLALPKRLPGFDWPVHQVLLSNGVLVAENLAEFGHLVGERIELVCGALNMRGADGSPGTVRLRHGPALRAEYECRRRRLPRGKLRRLVRSSGANLYVQAADNAG